MDESLSTSSNEVGLEFIPSHSVENLRLNKASNSPLYGDTESVEQEVQEIVELLLWNLICRVVFIKK